MNRRSFIIAGTTALALSTQRVFGQVLIQDISGTSTTSELTGAQVDLGRTGFEFFDRYLDEENDVEIIGFSNATGSGSVRFMPAGSDPENYIEERIEAISEQMRAIEVVGTETFVDGGWMAMSILDSKETHRGVYMEVQLDAFTGYDVEVYFASDNETFADNFDLMQQVVFEGMEPFLFVDDSQVQTLTFPVVSASTSSRVGRGSSALDSGAANSKNTAAGSEDADPDDVVEAVRDHQAQFNDELDRFYEIIETLAEEGATSENEALLFADLMDLMFSWSGYPGAAGELAFPSSLSSLEAAYFEWADSVGETGYTMSAWMLGEGEIDAFFDALDAAVQLNSALSAELRTLGVVIKPGGQGFARPKVDCVFALNQYVSGHRVLQKSFRPQ